MNKLFLPPYNDCFSDDVRLCFGMSALAGMCCKLSSSVELNDYVCCNVVCMYL